MTNKCIKWLDKNKPLSPSMIFDLSKLKKNYSKLKKLYKNIELFYAIKANPHKKIIKLLNDVCSS